MTRFTAYILLVASIVTTEAFTQQHSSAIGLQKSTESFSSVSSPRKPDTSLNVLLEAGIDPLTTTAIFSAAFIVVASQREELLAETDEKLVTEDKKPETQTDVTKEDDGKDEEGDKETVLVEEPETKPIAEIEDPVESAADNVAKEDPVVPAPDIVAKEDPVEPAPDIVAKEDPVEPVADIVAKEDPVEPVADSVAKIDDAVKETIEAMIEEAESAPKEIKPKPEPVSPFQTPDIATAKKRVASTLAERREMQARLERNTKKEEPSKDEPVKMMEPGPQKAIPKPVAITPMKVESKKKSSVAVRIAKKMVMPWKKFSTLA